MNAVDLVSARLQERYGLMPRRTWATDLAKGGERIAALRGCGRDELLLRVLEDDELLLTLAGSVTVGETHFLRHPFQFEALADFTRERLAAPERTGKLQILSAGCASGEEAYSIPLALAMHLGSDVLSRIEVLGTDLSALAIAKARKAEYRPWSFRGVAPWILARFTNGEGEVREPIPALRAPVRFAWSTIQAQLAELPKHSLDAILFRNVAIYLSRETIAEIFAGFARALRPSGLLIIAPTDPRPDRDAWSPIDTKSLSIFRVRDEQPVVQAPRAPQPFVWSAPEPALARVPAPAEPSLRMAPVRAPAPLARAVPSAPVARPAPDLSAAVDAADRGETSHALAIIDDYLAAYSDSAAAHALRGRIHASENQNEEAVESLRRALFLDGDQHIARYWYATALRAERRLEPARLQLRTLLTRLDASPPDKVLEDGITTRAELEDAARFLLEGLS